MANTILPFNVTAGMAYTSDTPIGITGSLPVFTYPDGVTTYNSAKGTLYYDSKYVTGGASKTVKANRTYFTVVQFPRNTNIKSTKLTQRRRARGMALNLPSRRHGSVRKMVNLPLSR